MKLFKFCFENFIRFSEIQVVCFPLGQATGLTQCVGVPRPQERFDEFFKELWRGNSEAHPVPEAVGPVELSIPHEGLLYDYVFVYRQKGAWKHWPELLRGAKMTETINIQQMVVPTVESLKYGHLLEMHVRHSVPFLLVGPTGTGKSFYIQVPYGAATNFTLSQYVVLRTRKKILFARRFFFLRTY